MGEPVDVLCGVVVVRHWNVRKDPSHTANEMGDQNCPPRTKPVEADSDEDSRNKDDEDKAMHKKVPDVTVFGDLQHRHSFDRFRLLRIVCAEEWSALFARFVTSFNAQKIGDTLERRARQRHL